MNILFAINIKSHRQSDSFNTILLMLNPEINNLELYITGMSHNLKIPDKYKILAKRELPWEKNYDIVLAFNKASLNKIRKFAEKNKLPLIYLFEAADFSKEYPNDFRLINQTLLINAHGNYPKNIFPEGLAGTLQLPVNIPTEKEHETSNSKKPVILVDVNGENDSSPLYQIIPMLNAMPNCEVYILSRTKTFPKIFNPNVKIIQDNTVIVEEITTSADIIIGTQKAIETGIGNCKPCIVVGNRGYGGIISATNFSIQYKTNYQGRIGGELSEYIPEQLIVNDIMYILEKGDIKVNEIVSENYKLLMQEYKRTTTYLHNLLQTEIEHNSVLNCNFRQVKLKVADHFSLSQISKTNYVISYAPTRQNHSTIEIEEYKIIEQFRNGKKVEDSIEENGYTEQSELFTEFIEELVKEKILVLDE